MPTKTHKTSKPFFAALQWNEIKALWLANTLIAILLSIFSFNPEFKIWLRSIARNFVFAQCIGHSIYSLAYLSKFQRINNKVIKLLALTGIFVVGGWLGTLIGLGFNALLLNFKVSSHYVKSFFIGITVFNVFIASIVYSYFVLRSRLQETAAKLAEKEVNEQRLLRLKTRAELEVLRAKVNPHFLFNTLNSIASLIPVEPTKAEEMVQKLAHLFRYTLDAGRNEMVKLSEELQLLKEYLEIEKVRLGKRLEYKIEVDERLSGLLIPGLLLQPLVENSVKHGIARAKSGGRIQIKCSEDNGYCQIEIHDNGKGFISNENGQGFGLSGVRERLSLHYGNDHEMHISNEQGVRILMRIPISNKDTKASSESKLPPYL